MIPVRKIGIVEVGPRDGLQNEATEVPTEVKIEFVRRAVDAGLQRIEVASFVNPRRVPQMADAEAVLKALPRRAGVRYIGLVLNRAGFDRAAAAGCAEIGMVVFTTDAFNRRNQGVDSAQSIRVWREIAAAAHAAGIRAQVTISAAFGCPFEGEVVPSRVVEIAREVAEGAPFEIAIADTIGVGVPGQVSELFGLVSQALPGMSLRGHFHNTRNTGLANAYAAVLAGAETLDASLGGLGGCPFAPAATGNIPTEDLLYMLGRMNLDTGVDLERAIETARWVEQQVGHTVPGMLVKAGSFPKQTMETTS
ncbi:MAG: hydroxymethylglutaryl-CoA lyase [Pseudomonadota bacterium]|nr:hydroxymethylglutaryl-CoA lyase [Pseudomonadota bacterium]